MSGKLNKNINNEILKSSSTFIMKLLAVWISESSADIIGTQNKAEVNVWFRFRQLQWGLQVVKVHHPLHEHE